MRERTQSEWIERLKKRLLSRRKIDTKTGCWLYTKHRDRAGYGRMRFKPLQLHPNTAGKVHRFAAIAWLEMDPADPRDVCHRCDTPPCFSPGHIFVGTRLDNQVDSVLKNRKPHGRGHYRAKLDDEKAREIVRRHRAGETVKAIAAAFGVGKRTVELLLAGFTWWRATGLPRRSERQERKARRAARQG